MPAGRVKYLAKGIAVGDKIASGKVRLLDTMDTRDIHALRFEAGDVLVTDMTDPDWEPIMKKQPPSLPIKVGGPATQLLWPGKWESRPS